MAYELRPTKGQAEIEHIAKTLLANYQRLFNSELKIESLKEVVARQVSKSIEAYLLGVVESFNVEDLMRFPRIVKDLQDQKAPLKKETK